MSDDANIYESHWTYGLSVRAANSLNNFGITSREEAIEAIKSGRMSPGKMRNYGWKSHSELLRFLGLPEAKKLSRVYTLNGHCPHCGKSLK